MTRGQNFHAITILQPFGTAKSTTTCLGYFAPGDNPPRRESGVYKVAGNGWYAQVYRTRYGPYTREAQALWSLAAMESRGPVGWQLWAKRAKLAGTLLLKILAGVFCLVTLWLLMATV
jgi:hypothetical protein